ncbi:hypothetical protein R1flu_020396 [Riccia fluitans]|uniref:Uncharacterized protein n=1 Tax=Riccia fluitans TaxID=41844 RepID=A0ABD1ZLD8_9MARC
MSVAGPGWTAFSMLGRGTRGDKGTKIARVSSLRQLFLAAIKLICERQQVSACGSSDRQLTCMANSLTDGEGNGQQRHQKHSPNQHSKEQHSLSYSVSPLLCDQSSAAALDIIILLLVLGACGFLFTPYFKYVAHEAAEVLPVTFLIIGEVIYQAPVAYAAGAIIMFLSLIGAWEIYQYKSRRCDNPYCRGLRKAVELDIQLQTEQCVKSGPLVAEELPWNEGLEIGQDQKAVKTAIGSTYQQQDFKVRIRLHYCWQPRDLQVLGDEETAMLVAVLNFEDVFREPGRLPLVCGFSSKTKDAGG